MYPMTAENPFDAINKFYMMRKPPASDHIMAVPKANIFEHCRNMTRARRLHWRTEIDVKNDKGKTGTKMGYKKSDDGLLADQDLLEIMPDMNERVCVKWKYQSEIDCAKELDLTSFPTWSVLFPLKTEVDKFKSSLIEEYGKDEIVFKED